MKYEKEFKEWWCSKYKDCEKCPIKHKKQGYCYEYWLETVKIPAVRKKAIDDCIGCFKEVYEVFMGDEYKYMQIYKRINQLKERKE